MASSSAHLTAVEIVAVLEMLSFILVEWKRSD